MKIYYIFVVFFSTAQHTAFANVPNYGSFADRLVDSLVCWCGLVMLAFVVVVWCSTLALIGMRWPSSCWCSSCWCGVPPWCWHSLGCAGPRHAGVRLSCWCSSCWCGVPPWCWCSLGCAGPRRAGVTLSVRIAPRRPYRAGAYTVYDSLLYTPLCRVPA